MARTLIGVCALSVGWGGGVQGGASGAPILRRETQSCMGTQWHIALYAEDASSANAGLEQAWAEIREIDKQLSHYQSDSELNQFCREAPHQDYIQVGEHLAEVLHAAADVSQKSAGYFDVTIAPVANLWRRARAKHALPKPEQLAEAREKVHWQYVQFGKQPRQVRITKPGVKIDLGGIAKGYAVDRAIAVLQTAGIRTALVNGGGDLRAIGTTPESQGWPVEISGIRPSDSRRTLTLHNAALATSGDAWQYLEVDGKRYSHLIDPHTGIGSTRRMSVSVHAPTCMQADALASALSVMPVEEGLALAKRLDVRVRIVQVTEPGEIQVRETEGFPTE